MEGRLKLRGKAAVVTGGAGGIGKAAASALAEAGCRVLLVDLNKAAVEATCEELNVKWGKGMVRQMCGDVGEEETAKQYVAECVASFGSLDFAFLNAGAGPRNSNRIVDSSMEDLEFLWRVNVVGVFAGLKHCMRAMQETGGSIVCTTSAIALGGNPGCASYGASKAAVSNLVKCGAAEGAEAGIRVNGIIPGTTKTQVFYDTLDRMTPPGADRKVMEEKWRQKIPMRRFGEVEEVADLVLFLAGSTSAYCTGQVFVADGGRTSVG